VSLSDALASFTQPTQLAAEHRRLMEEHHRPVDWSRSTVDALPPPLRAGLAAMWRARMVSEHRAVGIFQLYGLDLLAAGAPAEVLSLACRAALDEVRHAELFARLTTIYSRVPETPPPGIPPLSEDPTIPIEHQVAREALHLSVGSETFSAVLLQEKRERAADPVVRDVLGVVIADEIHHARMGWAFLSALVERRAEDAKAAEMHALLQRELVPLFDDLTAAMFGDPHRLPAPGVAEAERGLATAHGWMSTRDEYALYRSAIDEVWIPGLREMGLDCGEIAERYPRAG
jgi:rubrerythrin